MLWTASQVFRKFSTSSVSNVAFSAPENDQCLWCLRCIVRESHNGIFNACQVIVAPSQARLWLWISESQFRSGSLKPPCHHMFNTNSKQWCVSARLPRYCVCSLTLCSDWTGLYCTRPAGVASAWSPLSLVWILQSCKPLLWKHDTGSLLIKYMQFVFCNSKCYMKQVAVCMLKLVPHALDRSIHQSRRNLRPPSLYFTHTCAAYSEELLWMRAGRTLSQWLLLELLLTKDKDLMTLGQGVDLDILGPCEGWHDGTPQSHPVFFITNSLYRIKKNKHNCVENKISRRPQMFHQIWQIIKL